jgi:heterodisulfide reductase subunit C
MVRCPMEVHITDLMYTLKRMAITEGQDEKSSAAKAPDWSESFIGYVENFGRSFELGLATRYHLKHHPMTMMRKASIGWNMLKRGRMVLRPSKIKNLGQLKAILAKAKEVGGTQA